MGSNYVFGDPAYHPDEFEDEEELVWNTFTLGLSQRIRLIWVSVHYMIVEVRGDSGFVLLEE